MEIERCVLFCYNLEECVAEEEDEASTASDDRSTTKFTLSLDPGLHIKNMCQDNKKPTIDFSMKALTSVCSGNAEFAAK